MPPANVATVLACIDILEEEPERLERLWEISDYMRQGLRDAGLNVWTSQTPIIPVVAGKLRTCFEIWRDLLEEGVFVNPIVPPAVPKGQSLLRTSYMATHTNEDLDFILDAFGRIGRKYGIVNVNGQPS
jgi:8-amino-7-oxononanoate synthase